MPSNSICAVAFAGVFFMAQSCFAETVGDYTAAANNDGCLAIPYSNWKERCLTHQSDAKLWCDGKGSRTCDERHLRSDAFLEKIRNLDSAIRDRSSQNKPDEVRDLQAKKKEAENELASARKEVERRLDITRQCIQHRVLVQKVFDLANDRVESERRDSSKAAIHPTLDNIKTKLTRGKGGHETEIREAQQVESFCKRQL
jgi:hypothetical protein